jgi:DNA-binding response OmpR family regulator
MSARILLLEDDRLFNETLQDFLEEEGFAVDMALDPYTALDLTFANNYDLYLFDVNLPYESGFDLLTKLRESQDATPTIFLTSREDKTSLREGFTAGADDYLKKPVDLEELHLRIHALLRRQIRHERLKVGAYLLESAGRTLYDESGNVVELSKKAVDLLILLLEAKGELVSLDTIKERLWAAGKQASDGALRVYVTQLKKHFPDTIENVRGLGYRWNL